MFVTETCVNNEYGRAADTQERSVCGGGGDLLFFV